MDKQKILNYLKQGYPQPTACALSRVEIDEFKSEYASDREFRLDVNEADAIGIKDQIDSLREASYGDYKAAIEYLKKRDKQNWSDTTKLELSIEQGRQEVLQEIQRRVPPEFFIQLCDYMVSDDE